MPVGPMSPATSHLGMAFGLGAPRGFRLARPQGEVFLKRFMEIDPFEWMST